jgi:hypothetical protein
MPRARVAATPEDAKAVWEALLLKGEQPTIRKVAAALGVSKSIVGTWLDAADWNRAAKAQALVGGKRAMEQAAASVSLPAVSQEDVDELAVVADADLPKATAREAAITAIVLLRRARSVPEEHLATVAPLITIAGEVLGTLSAVLTRAGEDMKVINVEAANEPKPERLAGAWAEFERARSSEH